MNIRHKSEKLFIYLKHKIKYEKNNFCLGYVVYTIWNKHLFVDDKTKLNLD